MNILNDFTYKTKLSDKTLNELNNIYSNCTRQCLFDWAWEVFFNAKDRGEISLEDAWRLSGKFYYSAINGLFE